MILTTINQMAADDPDGREAQLDAIPRMGGARLDEIARLAVFLASGDADYATGFTYIYRQRAEEKSGPPSLTVPYTRRQS